MFYQLVAFNDQFKKKERDEVTINHMWAVVAAAVHWLTTEDLGPWMGKAARRYDGFVGSGR